MEKTYHSSATVLLFFRNKVIRSNGTPSLLKTALADKKRFANVTSLILDFFRRKCFRNVFQKLGFSMFRIRCEFSGKNIHSKGAVLNFGLENKNKCLDVSSCRKKLHMYIRIVHVISEVSCLSLEEAGKYRVISELLTLYPK